MAVEEAEDDEDVTEESEENVKMVSKTVLKFQGLKEDILIADVHEVMLFILCIFFLFQSPNKDTVKKKKTTHKTAKSKKGINEVSLLF